MGSFVSIPRVCASYAFAFVLLVSACGSDESDESNGKPIPVPPNGELMPFRVNTIDPSKHLKNYLYSTSINNSEQPVASNSQGGIFILKDVGPNGSKTIRLMKINKEGGVREIAKDIPISPYGNRLSVSPGKGFLVGTDGGIVVLNRHGKVKKKLDNIGESEFGPLGTRSDGTSIILSDHYLWKYKDGKVTRREKVPKMHSTLRIGMTDPYDTTFFMKDSLDSLFSIKPGSHVKRVPLKKRIAGTSENISDFSAYSMVRRDGAGFYAYGQFGVSQSRGVLSVHDGEARAIAYSHDIHSKEGNCPIGESQPLFSRKTCLSGNYMVRSKNLLVIFDDQGSPGVALRVPGK